MIFYLYALLGFLGGIPGGMGMGGGTVTIPLLVLFLDVPQKIAQSANLFAFLPMGLFALNIHKKNGLLQSKGILPVVLSALVLSAIGSLLASILPSDILRKAFGVFLSALSVFTFRSAFSGQNS